MEEKGTDSQDDFVPKRRKSRKGNLSFRKKYSWRSSSSASEPMDSDMEKPHCEKSFHEEHICSDDDEFSGLSTTPGVSTTTEASESEEVPVVKKRRRRKRKRFLSHRKIQSTKNVGSVTIVGKSGDTSETSDSTDLSDLEVCELDEILCSTNVEIQTFSNSAEHPSTVCSSTVDRAQNKDDDQTLSNTADVKTTNVERDHNKDVQQIATCSNTAEHPSTVCSSTVDQAQNKDDDQTLSNTADVKTTNVERDHNKDVQQIETCSNTAEHPSTVDQHIPAFSSSFTFESVKSASGKLLPDPKVPQAIILALQENLKLLLPNVWTVDVQDGTLLRIMRLATKKNASVDCTVYYDGMDKSVGIFVHNVPVSPENRVFKCNTVPDSDNVGSLADFLSELIMRVDLMKVCCGISEHEDLWDTSRGFIDYSSPSPRYRSGSCHLLVKRSADKCQDCQAELKSLEREVKRNLKKTSNTDSSQTTKSNIDSTPDKYLSNESLIEKKNFYRNKYRLEKQKTKRLEKKLDKVKIQLDAALSDELSSILNVHQNKMTPLQKLFWEQQRRALSLNDARGMRWHPMLIRIALHLHSLSDGAYKFLGDSKLLMLPSKRRLYDYSHFIEPQEGCQEEFLQSIKDKIEKCGPEEHFLYVNLMFDEMHIRSGLVVRRSTGELIGYTKLDDCEEELKKMQDDIESKKYKPQLAKKVLVYLANGITSTVKDVVAIYSTDILSASHLYERTWEVIYNLEDAGIRVLSLTCDGASVNRKFLLMHESLDKKSKYTFCTKNLAAGSRPLFFILDPPHLLKTIRNALGNSFSHKKSRKLWKNNEYLSWKVIEMLYKLTEGDKFRTHKLTKAHIKLTSFSCMTVLYATQVLSNSVAQSIEDLANHKEMENFQTSELVKFIRLMNRFFDCVNTKEDQENESEEKEPEVEGQEKESEETVEMLQDKAPYTRLNDSRFQFLQDEFLGYFNDWKDDIDNRPGNFSDADKSRMTISHQGLGAVEITVHGIVGAIRYMISAGAPSVSARAFNQDPIEQYFGKVRRAMGDNNNPFLKNFHDTRINLHAQGLVASASQKGNTEAQKRKEIEIDATPLPTRKKQRK
ncbi:uncharacterized protein LOC117643252 [Thrips palmi]|uniref:Uncharacterized protein LOC117643252 n=1 Tax=Thrips palmi TaxID=161013 RepID=A0A6P8YUV8_THRPL|nr:uncharacterized protein LOC117643252 [Thrips palmi]